MENTSLEKRESDVVATTRREAERVATPRADVIEAPEAVVVKIEVPGVDANQVDVTLEHGILTVEARTAEVDHGSFELSWCEYNPTVYRRRFSVSDRIDSEGISAELRHGVLEVRLAKAEPARARTIEVHA
jgi:HSP20 family molecular chaperone IbpA